MRAKAERAPAADAAMSDASDRLRSVSIYSIIIFLSAAAALNPFTTKYLLGLSNGWVIFPAIFDAYAAVTIACGALYLRTARAICGIAVILSIIAVVPVMLGAELAIYYHHLEHEAEGPPDYLIENVHRHDGVLGWAPIPNGSSGRHYSRDNFDVRYSFDHRGRRLIPQNPRAERTLHVFGDSFTFGHGVSNEETALALLAGKINHRINVLNWAVMGYGLEQMVLRLEQNLDEIKPGDLVLFQPLHTDIARSMIARAFPCGQHYGSDRVETFPMFEAGKWRSVVLSQECNYALDRLLIHSKLVFGLIRKQYLQWVVGDRLFRNADAMLDMARRLATSKGAKFAVVLPVAPNECINGIPQADWTGVKTAYTYLARECPADPAQAMMYRFPVDGHLSVPGNAWFAESLLKYLRETGNYP